LEKNVKIYFSRQDNEMKRRHCEKRNDREVGIRDECEKLGRVCVNVIVVL
jgi:hypothetical protein